MVIIEMENSIEDKFVTSNKLKMDL